MALPVEHIHLVVMTIPVDKGMAGTTRLRNLLKYLPQEHVSITNLVHGDEEDEYEFMNVKIKKFSYISRRPFSRLDRLRQELKRELKESAKNILLFYDAPHPLALAFTLRWAQRQGYLVVVDTVEDYNTQLLNLGLKGNMRLIMSGLIQKKMKYYADAAIGISGYLMEFLNKHFSEKPTIHLPIAFDPESLVNEVTKKDNPGEIVVFYGGTFGEKDGMEFLLKGFEWAASQNKNLVLKLTGKGSQYDMEKFEMLVRHSSARNRIKNFGFVSYGEYCQIMGSADILCMTRKNTKFANAGFPYKLDEFLASGKPVIVSRLSDVQRYVPEDACCYVTPESSDEIGKAILTLNDPDKRKEIGQRGKEIAFEKFDARKSGENLYNFLKSLNR